MQVVRLRASTRRVITPSALACAETVGCSMEPALRFAPQPWAPAVSCWLLGGHVPACLFARLFTSSLNSASARPRYCCERGWTALRTGRGVHRAGFPGSSGQFYCAGWFPVRPRKRTSRLGYGVWLQHAPLRGPAPLAGCTGFFRGVRLALVERTEAQFICTPKQQCHKWFGRPAGAKAHTAGLPIGARCGSKHSATSGSCRTSAV